MDEEKAEEPSIQTAGRLIFIFSFRILLTFLILRCGTSYESDM
jgi:hypothetical protein